MALNSMPSVILQKKKPAKQIVHSDLRNPLYWPFQYLHQMRCRPSSSELHEEPAAVFNSPGTNRRTCVCTCECLGKQGNNSGYPVERYDIPGPGVCRDGVPVCHGSGPDLPCGQYSDYDLYGQGQWKDYLVDAQFRRESPVGGEPDHRIFMEYH